MRLELASYRVRDVRPGPRTVLEDGVLQIDHAELARLLTEDPVLEDVRVELARPGESVRIVHVMDAVEPRVRVSAPGSDFPGLLSPPFTVGHGRTHRLDGVAVLTAGSLPLSLGGLNVKEAIVDMSGPAAPFVPFARTLNVVLVCTVRDGLGYAEYDAAIRKAGLRAAVYLAETSRAQTPDAVETFEMAPARPELPRIAYTCLLMQEGDVHHDFVYGRTIDETPTLLHPNEFLDGAVVNGEHHIAAYLKPTYFHQNHPIIRELYRRQGQDLNFVGVVITKCLTWANFDKQRSAHFAAKLARLLGAEAVVISAGTGGHAVADLMLNCQAAEQAGLRTALTCFEMAGDDGSEFGFVTYTPEADAVVSTGNMDEIIELPPVERVIGGDSIIDIGNYEGGGGTPAMGAVRTAMRRLYACASLVGPGAMTTSVV
jgi:glycine reductase complex component B subunit alpha and beta